MGSGAATRSTSSLDRVAQLVGKRTFEQFPYLGKTPLRPVLLRLLAQPDAGRKEPITGLFRDVAVPKPYYQRGQLAVQR